MLFALSIAGLALAADPPDFSAQRGLQTAPLSLTLTADVGDAVIQYSVDGGLPDTDYSGPIEISATTVVRARSQSSDGTLSDVATHTYVFVADVLEQPAMHARARTDADWQARITDTLSTLPTLSVATEVGLSQTEAAASFEYIDPDGDLDVQIDCGIARVGGHSLGYAKTNLRLYFRGEYGEGRLKEDFFEDIPTIGVPSLSDHDSLDLRGGSHDSVFYLWTRGQYLRNRWMDETELEMGHTAPHGRHGHLYVNGEYTGLYQLRERFDAAFLAEHWGGSEDDYAAVNGGRTVDGDASVWPAIEAASTRYATFRTWVDVDQYLDYIVLNLYGANTWDWNPYQNWMAAGPPEAASAWVFHSSDNDICLYYPVDHDVSDRVGPAHSLENLLLEGDVDFQVGLMDALHRNLRGSGALVGTAAADRYAALAVGLEDAVVAEAARWGGGGWDPDVHWTTERDHLVYDWLPHRADALLSWAEARGWMPLPPVDVSPPPGPAAVDTVVEVAVPDGVDAQVVVRFDGGDPRLSGGEVAPEAEVLDGRWSALLARGQHVQARLWADGVWGPLEVVDWTVDSPGPIALNEWNAVQPGEVLDDDGEDSAFGVIDGNGGPWVELLVLEDGLDLRGAWLSMSDLYGKRGQVVLGDAEVLSDLRAGTLLTIARDLPEDLAYDPDAGDWRFHLQARPDGPTAWSDGFTVTPHNWQLTVRLASGEQLAAPTGEGHGEGAATGLSGDEVGLLEASPLPGGGVSPRDYAVASSSTYGAPNVWEDGQQDLSALRGEPVVTDPEGDTAEEPESRDSALPPEEPAATDSVGEEQAEDTDKSGCMSASTGVGLWWLGGLVVAWRRRGLGLGLGLVGCASPATRALKSPGAPDSAAVDSGQVDRPRPEDDTAEASDCVPSAELCNGEDDDCDGEIDEADADLVDGLPFYADRDADGHGGTERVSACALAPGLSLTSDDCDDTDATVFPGAEETCDGVDRNCDGATGEVPGRSAACAVDSCLAVYEADASAVDGAYWLALPSGTVTEVWCDMAQGGWTLGFLRSSASLGNQGDFGAGEAGLDTLSLSPDAASSSADGALGWMDLNAFAYDELVLTGHAWGETTVRSEAIPRRHLRLSFGEDGYLLYGDPSPYVWCGGDRSYTDGRTGQVDPPEGAPPGCRAHGSLGSGWDFSGSYDANLGLTLCGSDGYGALTSTWGSGWVFYGAPGGAQAIWVR